MEEVADRLLGARGFSAAADGALTDAMGLRVAAAPRDFLRSLRLVIEKDASGAWKTILKASGRACGKSVAAHLDAELIRLAQPALGALPLESCLVLIERYFALNGWGRVKLDLADAATHGLVVARLEHSAFAEALADTNDFVDPLLAGVLRGFFEHISGEPLGCEEIACVRRGAPHCTFVITAQERLDVVAPQFGRDPADAILAQLKS